MSSVTYRCKHKSNTGYQCELPRGHNGAHRTHEPGYEMVWV